MPSQLENQMRLWKCRSYGNHKTISTGPWKSRTEREIPTSFMNRLVKSARWSWPRLTNKDRSPVSARSPFNQQGVCARTGPHFYRIVKRSVSSRLLPARSLILLFALLCGTQRAGAQ